MKLPRAAPLLALGAVAAILVGVRLASAYGAVPNRFSFGWDAARRAMLNLEAATALRRGALMDLFWHLAGPETWPTLRMVFAAPLLALTGPSLAAESGLSIGFYALLFPALALAVHQLSPSRWSAALIFAVAALALATHHGLLAYSTTGMIEPLAALTTLMATTVWMVQRCSPRARVWPLALAGNLVFHTKWQYGLILAAATLLSEAGALSRDERRRALAGLAEVAGASRRHATTWVALALVAATGLSGFAIGRSGGLEFTVAGLRVTARSPDGPIFWCAFFAFYGALLELWRGRTVLTEAVPRRLRSLFAWLVVPMGAWILVPFTWRLRTLLFTATSYDSHVTVAPGPFTGIAFYFHSFWEESYGPFGRAGLATGLAILLLFALRDAGVRRRLVPIFAISILELLVLGVASHKNLQSRFLLNLAPLLAMMVAAGLCALPRWPRLAAALLLLGLFGVEAFQVWRGPELVPLLSRGFSSPDVPEACLPLARALPFEGGDFMNATGDGWRQDCSLAFLMEAVRRRVNIDVYAAAPAPNSSEVIYLSEGCGTADPALASWSQSGREVRSGPLCARLYRRAERDR